MVLTTRSGARVVLLAHGRKRVKIRREFLDAIVALVDLVATGGAVWPPTVGGDLAMLREALQVEGVSCTWQRRLG